ncbi:AAA family ATPase [uncultured Pseudokineococcus sp.]|uniref:AAA family ATPase n=1 Tax=uncultured Pseudokineococcus sp. TaxID=1642928 RepID=UPI0026241BE0|nr:AAA family ATPase [uncultured Pseudokineococcus sp.]
MVRFSALKVSNFRAIEAMELLNLTDFIVIAGPNGSGKSCVFDALRLIKSVYGGYQANEYMQWFGEFQINLNDRRELARLFREPTREVSITATVQLSDEEKGYLTGNAESALEPLVWAEVTGQSLENYAYSTTAIATQYRQYGTQVAQRISERAAQLRAALDAENYELRLTISPDFSLQALPCPVMEMVFQIFDPDHLGILDYHSASRSYQRETVGGVNLDARQVESQRRSQSLYNWQGKYANVKTELAATYIRELIARESGTGSSVSDLNETLKELFATFFPDKEYLGVQAQANGTLSFPVRTRAGQLHDINDLSSGEKEVVYGYLRLKASTPRNSTILLDEPELHLNPGLLQGFPDFYHRHLGRAQGNQLWLVTHSDALLRQAVGNGNFSVFHMTTASEPSTGNQAIPVLADSEAEQAIIDLVGDLATYRPQGAVVLFEGGGDTEIDVLITSRLFPAFAGRVNLVSGGSKKRVRDLREVLSQTAQDIGLADRFYAITDKDSAAYTAAEVGARHFSWDVYHIENYLLEPKFIRAAAVALLARDPFSNDDDVLAHLRVCAEQLVSDQVMERLQAWANDALVASIQVRGPSSPDPADALMPSITATFSRLDKAREQLTNREALQKMARTFDREVRDWLADDSWIKEFPGRRLLKAFVGQHLGGSANYEAFRNLVLDKMVDAGHQPAGMQSVIDRIRP